MEEIEHNFGFVRSVEDANKVVIDFEQANTLKFSVYKVNKGFGNTGKYFIRYSHELY